MHFTILSFATLLITPTILARPLEYQKAKRANAGQFGDCSDPTIAFGDFDGRKETSFNPGNPKDYNVSFTTATYEPHGSADNSVIIGQFNCDTLLNKCGLKQGDAGHDLCLKALATLSATDRSGAAADKFNAVLGVTSNFGGTAVVNDQGQTITAGTAPQVSLTLVVDGAGGDSNAVAAKATPLPVAAKTVKAVAENKNGNKKKDDAAEKKKKDAAAKKKDEKKKGGENKKVNKKKGGNKKENTKKGGSKKKAGKARNKKAGKAGKKVAAAFAAEGPRGTSGDNLNKFKGSLGGIASSPVIPGGRADGGFTCTADNSTDENLAAAVQRCCSVQNNKCADQANKQHQKPFSVADCNAQEKQCEAQ